MSTDETEFGDAENHDDSTVESGGQPGPFIGRLFPISPFSPAKLGNMLYELTMDIHTFERLVLEEEGRKIQSSELIETLEPRKGVRMGKILLPFAYSHPVQKYPEPLTDWGAVAYHHIRHAWMAIDDGDEVAFWREFYAARRMELFGLEELGEEYLERQAESIRLEAAGLAARDGLLRLDAPRKNAIQNILGDIEDHQNLNGSIGPKTHGPLTANRVGAAMHILHEFYIDQRLTGRILELHLRSFISIMMASAITFIVAFLSIPLREGQSVPDRLELLQSPLSGLIGLPKVAQLIILVLIVVLGVMGASVSGILSLSRELHRSRIPEQAGTVWFAVSRLVTGGVGALMLFLFLVSGVVSFGGDSSSTGFLALNLGGDLTVALVFSLSFIAGFSERVLVRVVESVAGDEPDQTGKTPD